MKIDRRVILKVLGIAPAAAMQIPVAASAETSRPETAGHYPVTVMERGVFLREGVDYVVEYAAADRIGILIPEDAPRERYGPITIIDAYGLKLEDDDGPVYLLERGWRVDVDISADYPRVEYNAPQMSERQNEFIASVIEDLIRSGRLKGLE